MKKPSPTDPGSAGKRDASLYRDLMRGPTGHDERLVPEVSDPGNLAQHLRRYEFALQYCKGKIVVDSGCGVGYGANIVGAVSKCVYGIDYDRRVLAHASAQYGSDRMQFIAGDVAAVPLPDECADVVLSFEVIEHVSDHERLLRECTRLLRGGGFLVISTPNTVTTGLFRKKEGFTFDAHVSEVTLEVFRDELERHFTTVQIMGMQLRGPVLYRWLRGLDRWNLRLRLLPRAAIHFTRERVFRIPSQKVSTEDVLLSHTQLRQANHFLAVCTGKIGRRP